MLISCWRLLSLSVFIIGDKLYFFFIIILCWCRSNCIWWQRTNVKGLFRNSIRIICVILLTIHTSYLKSEYLCPFSWMLKAVHSTICWTHVANILELSPDIFLCTEHSCLSNIHNLYSSCNCLENVLTITWTPKIASFPWIWSVFVVLPNRIAYAWWRRNLIYYIL